MAIIQRNQTIKWGARRDALKKQQELKSLSADVCENRARYAQNVYTAAMGDAMLMGNDDIHLYCARTGAVIGTVSHYLLGQLAQMPAETYAETAELFHARRQYHPAFINLSPERLAKLQALFPIEYCVYAAHELQHDSDATNGEARNAILRWLGGQSLAHVCETAELLRRVLAIIGHYHAQRNAAAARNATPAGIDADIAAMRTQSADMPIIGEFAANNRRLADYITALKAYFSAVVRKSQAEHHVQSIFRARQVSFHDVRRMAITLGRTQFRAARENTRNIDNAAFLDVAELFENDSELTMAINAKHAEAAKPQRYAGTAVKIENAITFDPPLPIPADIAADIQATLDATMPLAHPPIAAPAPSTGAPTLKIRLFK